jgi:hypothetical protein
MTQTATMTQEPQQRMRALERANEVRLKRAELKRRIADGHLTAADVVLELPPEAKNWSVGELLKCQRRWGSIRSHKLLAGLQISEKRPIGNLTDRQRRLIADRIAMHAPRELAVQGRRPDAEAVGTPRVEPATLAHPDGEEVLEVDVSEAPDVELRGSRELQLVGA